MKKFQLPFIFILLFSTICANAENNDTDFEVIEPINKGLYVGPINTVVVKASPKIADKILISLDNNTTYSMKVKKGRGTYCVNVELGHSKNNIKVDLIHEGKVVKEKNIDIYQMQELFEGDSVEPLSYTKNYFHTDEKEKKCSPCHDMTSNLPKGDSPLDDVTTATCYTCHESMLNTKNTHAPTVNWLCNKCHNGKVGDYNSDEEGLSKYLVESPVKYVCGKCHDTVQDWDFNRYIHGPVNDGKCVRCHNPHGSNNEFFLRKHIWDLCTTCHTEKAIPGNHIVSGFVFTRNKGAHPTKDRKDPARPGREFVCTSCHNPHGSSGIYLLRMKGSHPFNVCKRCHKK